MALPVPKHLRSRLLYPNPVCILTTVGATGERNAMVVSWLTAIDNRGTLFLSMNTRRHSAALLRETGVFGIGGCHGPQEGQTKLAALGVETCAPGWAGDPQPGVPAAVSDCVAHLVCRARLDAVQEVEGHLAVIADTEEAFVRSTHWDGKRFLPVAPGAPPALTFFGSGTFGCAVPAEEDAGGAAAADAADAPL